MDAAVVRPFVNDLADEFGSVVHRDRPGQRMLRTRPVEGLDEALAVQREIGPSKIRSRLHLSITVSTRNGLPLTSWS